MNIGNNGDLSPIQEFYKGRSVFITGGTGLVGKVLVEKLLRCCPGIGKLYLLMRPKRGLSLEERRDALLNNELYSHLKEVMPSFKEHIVTVYGNILFPKLGISDEDMEKMKDDVSVVIHSAARVTFGEHISVAAKHNLIGTKYVIELCKDLPKIAVFVQISTTYCNQEADNTIPERVIEYKLTPVQLMDAVEWMDDFSLDKATEAFVKERNNTYSLTKALAEIVVVDNCGNIPTAIVRPAQVGSIWKDPIPGWCDTVQGANGIGIAIFKGVLRTMHMVPGVKVDIIPADVVANTIIATAWYRSTKQFNEFLVVNCTGDREKLPDFDAKFFKELLRIELKYPLTQIYRYPDITLYDSWFLYKIHFLVDQYIPAFFLDLFLYVFTGKLVMTPLYEKMEYIINVIFSLQSRRRIVKRENFKRITKSLSKKDSEIFFMEVDDINYTEYFETTVMGGRKYLVGEDLSTLPYAKKKAKIWWFVTSFLKWMIFLSCGYFVITKHLP